VYLSASKLITAKILQSF